MAEIIIENNQAKGVRLSNDEEIKATKAVISNASIWDTLALIPEGMLDSESRSKSENSH